MTMFAGFNKGPTRNSAFRLFIAESCIFLLFFLLVTISPLAAEEKLSTSASSPASEISKNRLSTIIVDNYYPYTFINEQGKPDGFSVDLARAVADVMGLTLEIRSGFWDDAQQALLDGRIDFLPMMAYSKERDKYFDFSEPHTIAYDAFFVKQGFSRLITISDLKGMTVIVMKNDVAHDYLISHGFAAPENLVLVAV